MLYFSEGGFTHSEIYGMPIYLRNFYYRELASVKKEEKKIKSFYSEYSQI